MLTLKTQALIGPYTEVTKRKPQEMRAGLVVTPTGQIDPTGHFSQKEETIAAQEKDQGVLIGTPEAIEADIVRIVVIALITVTVPIVETA